jgi:hypothetical protein
VKENYCNNITTVNGIFLNTFWLVTVENQNKLSRFKCRCLLYKGADKSLAQRTSQCILFDGENISFDSSLVLYIYIYIYSTNIPQIMIINRIYETQNLLSL